ncbi:sce7726 family protein [Myxococcus fulvus]|uniref:sce7726 family protein n=1 Tax=Myxococcus fulvus TaxID=33 RepID=UPI003B995501
MKIGKTCQPRAHHDCYPGKASRHVARRTDTDGEIHGYEIKSERDTLVRLPRQVAAYGAALVRATLVVSEGHLAKASALVPEWWGLSIARSVAGSAVHVEAHRFAARNPEQQMLSVARLLWRSEALSPLEEVGAARFSAGVSWNALRLNSYGPGASGVEVANAMASYGVRSWFAPAREGWECSGLGCSSSMKLMASCSSAKRFGNIPANNPAEG